MSRPERVSWTGLRDGPFPVLPTLGELERAADVEWLHTNGAGAYAMSSLALMHTRRTHGILVAALDPPLDRHVMLSHGEVSVEVQGKTYRLSTHQFPNIAPTPGFRLLQAFAMDPIPRWEYNLGGAIFERRLAFVRGRNIVVLAYTWHGSATARMSLRPLMPFRPVNALMREHGAMVQRVLLRPGEVEVQPMSHLPPIMFRHRGVFVGSPDWWRRFEYPRDRDDGLDFVEDMWTPGAFELELPPGATEYLVVGAEPLPDAHPRELVADTVEFELRLDPGPGRPQSVRALSVAAEAYCAHLANRPAIIAGYPHLDVITRDTLQALPGLYLARHRIDAARAVLETVIQRQRDGLVPFRLESSEAGQLPPAPDATLWLFEVTRELLEVVGPEDPFVRRRLYPALLKAFVRLQHGRKYGIWLSRDGLLANGFHQLALTWMDARLGDLPVTPRRGLAVEFQALWARGCETLAELARAYRHRGIQRAAQGACYRAREAFRERFWCNETDYPFDCLSEEFDSADAWADASVRPNAVIALAVDPELFDGWQAAAIIGRARDELLTPRGLRSLSPRERAYRGHYEGRPEERHTSYHQGTAWAFLLGAFVRATLRLSPDDAELRAELTGCVESALQGGPVLGHVAQLADGEVPHRWRGCPAQGWSAGELLRALTVELGH